MRKPRAKRCQEARFTPIVEGGVASALGFSASGVHAGFYRQKGRLDCALVVADSPCACTALFTRNVFCAAPVVVSRSHLRKVSFGFVRAILLNSGNANAITGSAGVERARQSTRLVAAELGCREDEVLVASTGALGMNPPLELFERGVPLACKKASRVGGHDAARAIMAADTFPKECAVAYESSDAVHKGRLFTVGGMAKGPEMLLVLTTDAPLSPSVAHRALDEAAHCSINKVTVDPGASTNDSCFLFASGCAAQSGKLIREGTQAYEEFASALKAVCENLSRQIALDGNGGSSLITIHVEHAFDLGNAERVARSVANSLCIRTSIVGKHANWAHVVSAIGYADALYLSENVAVDVMGAPVLRKGELCLFDEQQLLRQAEKSEIVIRIDLGAGDASATYWTGDRPPG